MEAGLLATDALVSLPIWPVQLFEAAGLFALAALMWVIGARQHRRGLILGIYLTCYAAMRFALEYLRGDEVRGLFFGGLLSTSQIISIVMFVIGAVVLATGHLRTPWEPLPVKGEKKRPPIRKGTSQGASTE
jgi:prolipoprotein diacylglyceryltransferase